MRLNQHVAAVLNRRSAINRLDRPRTGYVVFAGSYVSNSAGIQCLHRLCDELNRRGYPSFTTGGDVGAAHLSAPMVDAGTARALCERGFAAVYPETICGNPLNAENVIRWVLNRPGLLGGDKVYADSELVFTYSDVFSPYIKNTIAGKLYMPTINEQIFYCTDADLSKRNLQCYYIGKSKWRDGFLNRAQAYEITRESPNKSDLGKLFRASKVVYCFDNSSILIYEALFCGCPVVVIPDGTQTKQDFEQLELGMDGIAWGDEQPPSPPNLPRLCARYAAVKHSFVEQLERMIASSQDRAARPVEWGQFESAEAIECKVERISIGQRLTQGVQHVDQFLRESERAIRKFRKRCVAYMRQQRKNEATPSRDSAAFFCADDDLSKRTLQCYSLDDNYRPTSAFDVNEAMPIPPTMPSGHLGILLRASRRFYCFSRNDPLIECALRCGCPVTLVDSFNRKREVLRLPLPPHRSSAAA